VKADVEPRSSEGLARRIAAVALDKKARDVGVLDMRGVVAYTDFLVIATGNTERQTQAIEDAIYREMKSGSGEGRTPERVEGKTEARWIPTRKRSWRLRSKQPFGIKNAARSQIPSRSQPAC